jgi:hypothetical protein
METTERKNYWCRAINERGRVVVEKNLTGATENELAYFCMGLSYVDNLKTRYVVAYEVEDNGRVKLAKSVGTYPKHIRI